MSRKNRIEVNSYQVRPVNSALYLAGTTSSNFEKSEVEKMPEENLYRSRADKMGVARWIRENKDGCILFSVDCRKYNSFMVRESYSITRTD